MGKGDPITTPWFYEAPDYQQNIISITLNFDNTTRALSNAVVYRDAACVYHNIYFGLGPDGTPNTTPTQFAVPEGTSTITGTELNDTGLYTIEDCLALQVTAGP